MPSAGQFAWFVDLPSVVARRDRSPDDHGATAGFPAETRDAGNDSPLNTQFMVCRDVPGCRAEPAATKRPSGRKIWACNDRPR